MEWRGRYHLLSVQKQFLLLFALLCISFFVCYLVGMLAFVFSDQADISQISVQNINSFKWLQSWSSIGVFVLPSLMFLYLIDGSFIVSKRFSRQQLSLSLTIMLFSIPVINFLAMWNEGLHFPQFLADVEQWMRTSEAKSAAIIEYFLVMNSYTDLVINLVVIALIPAIGEELLFRGVIQRQITKWRNNHHLAIWVSAFLFSALHIQFLGFIPRFLIGAFFGYLFVWSGSIWLPIITHFFNNALAVILYFKSPLSLDMETIGAQEDQLSLVLLCFLAVCLLLYLLYQHCGQKKSPTVEEGI